MLKRIPMNWWRRLWHRLLGCTVKETELSWIAWFNGDRSAVDGYCIFCLNRFVGHPWADTAAGGCNSGAGIDWRELMNEKDERRLEKKLKRIGAL